MSDLLTATDLTSPVFLRKEALAAGYHERAITALVRSGAWVRLRHGAYTDAITWERADERERYALLTRAVLLQARSGVVVSHATAAVVHFGSPMWGVDRATVDITKTDRNAGRIGAGVRQHQGVLLPEDIEAFRSSGQVTSGTRTALDCTFQFGAEVALGIVNHLLHTEVTSLDALRARYATMQHHPGSLTTDLVLRLASPKIASLGESRTYFWLSRGAIPAPVLQHVIRGDDGHIVAYLDFAWPELGAWMEFDGLVKYTQHVPPGRTAADVVVAEKAREDLVRRITGWRCLRITWSDLADPRRFQRLVRDFLADRV